MIFVPIFIYGTTLLYFTIMSEETDKRIKSIEGSMLEPSFWDDPSKARATIKELQMLKESQTNKGKYFSSDAIMTIVAGAGGDDAEDFARMLKDMYESYSSNCNWSTVLLDKNANNHNGYRNLTLEVLGKNAYGTLKSESGVHRLVRLSPFNANHKRQTSFVLVEVSPKLENTQTDLLKEEELEISFTRSGGAGGQNVNKRETSVRITHLPTKLSVRVSNGRSQQQNRTKALHLLLGKFVAFEEKQRQRELKGLNIEKSVKIEWGNQIRSYVLHPYQLVKDHRTNLEVRNVNLVLAGDIQSFLDAASGLE